MAVTPRAGTSNETSWRTSGRSARYPKETRVEDDERRARGGGGAAGGAGGGRPGPSSSSTGSFAHRVDPLTAARPCCSWVAPWATAAIGSAR